MFNPLDKDDIEPAIEAVLVRRAARKRGGPYSPGSVASIADRLQTFIDDVAPGARVRDLGRLGGGASKEQFSFHLDGVPEWQGRYVLRMEPVQSISESDRRREVEVLHAVQGLVPAPQPAWLDADGEAMGQPAAIMRFVGGVTKPAQGDATVTGLGTVLGPRLRDLIGPQFIQYLADIHALDWRAGALPTFQEPAGDPRRAALWQLNWWSRVQREDCVQSLPVLALAERWMRQNLPAVDELVFVHGDYRTGNYLFDETSGAITAILDWELGHIGDVHEDLAWALQPLFGSVEDGRTLASGLYERDEMIHLYEAASGRRVDRATLHFYDVFVAYKCVVIVLATGVRAARDRHNHQDALLTWLAPIGHIFLAYICDLLEKGPAR